MNRRLLASIATMFFLGLVLPGCGNRIPMGKVSGTVTFDGKPVTEGTVLFRPEKGPAAVGALDQNGHYSLQTKSLGEGAVVGKQIVCVLAPTDVNIIGITGPGQLPKRTFPNIPEKFRRPETSGLTAEVKSGKNRFDFELKASQ